MAAAAAAEAAEAAGGPAVGPTSGHAAAAAPLLPIGDRKIRILCLHGYLQNAEVFRSRIGSLRKGLKSRAEFVFLDAPFLVAPEAAADAAVAENGGSSGAPSRSWWQWSDLEPGTWPSRAAQYTGWATSQAAIAAALREHAPIDGLLGFSQGATAAALFLAHAQLPESGAAGEAQQPAGEGQQAQQAEAQQAQQQPLASAEEGGGLRFAVVIAGFLPRDARYAAALRAGRPALPCLHVHGAADALVPVERSRGLWECFEPACVETYEHPGAHMVPTCSGEFKQVLVGLLDDAKGGWLHHPHRQRRCHAAAPQAPAQDVAAVAVG